MCWTRSWSGMRSTTPTTTSSMTGTCWTRSATDRNLVSLGGNEPQAAGSAGGLDEGKRENTAETRVATTECEFHPGLRAMLLSQEGCSRSFRDTSGPSPCAYHSGNELRGTGATAGLAEEPWAR